MSLIVDKEAVMQDVMSAINKHYAGYEQNISEMESIIKQLPMVQQLIKENEELKRRLESENIQLNVNELNTTSQTVDIKQEMNEQSEMSFKAFHDMMTNQGVSSVKPIIVKKEQVDEEDTDTIHALSGDPDDISQELMNDTNLHDNIEDEYEEEVEEDDGDSGSQPREEVEAADDGDSGPQPREEVEAAVEEVVAADDGDSVSQAREEVELIVEEKKTEKPKRKNKRSKKVTQEQKEPEQLMF